MSTQSKPCEPPYSGVQLLTRAYHLISAGPLNGNVCAGFCPWCALDQAHAELELEHRIKLPLHRVLTRLVIAAFEYYGTTDLSPLIDSKLGRGSWQEIFRSEVTQREALFVLRRAGAWVEEPRDIIRSCCPECGLEIYTSHEFCPECRRAGGPG